VVYFVLYWYNMLFPRFVSIFNLTLFFVRIDRSVCLSIGVLNYYNLMYMYCTCKLRFHVVSGKPRGWHSPFRHHAELIILMSFVYVLLCSVLTRPLVWCITPVCPSVCLSVCLPVYLSFWWSEYVSVRSFVSVGEKSINEVKFHGFFFI
jgi:hypothetical protein